MALLVDGDACPDLLEIKKIAIKNHVEMTVYVDYAHFIQDDYFKTVICEVGKDSTDFTLLKEVTAGDVVITQDYGLAGMILSKGAKVIHPSGKIIDDQNIDELLLSRYLSAKQRRSNKHISGPKKRDKLTRQYFLNQIDKNLK